MNAPAVDLQVEHLDVPLGLMHTAPRLSWKLPRSAGQQLGYRLRADTGWDTGWVESARNRLIPYAGPALGPAHRVHWQVRLRTEVGESSWSAPSWFETGLLSAADWTARWIEPGRDVDGAAADRAALLLRVEFDLDGPIAAARLYATAHGLYEAFLNGDRVGDAELTGGFTQYAHRLAVQTYDVGGQLRPGRNVLAVVLADGWYRGQIGISRAADQWGDRLALLTQLRIKHVDGSITTIGNGPGWRSTASHLAAADLIAEEHADLRALPRGWDRPGFDDTGWGRGDRRRPRVRSAGRLAGAAGASGIRDRPGVGHPPRRRPGSSSTSGRTSTAGSG
jgi:alpha-L-rhamnosidase